MGLRIFIALIYSAYCIHVLPSYLFPKDDDGAMAASDRDTYNNAIIDKANVQIIKTSPHSFKDDIRYTFVEKNRPTGD